MLSKVRKCPDCGKKLEVVYSGREQDNVYMCMNERCKSYGKSFGKYHIYDDLFVTLDNWM